MKEERAKKPPACDDLTGAPASDANESRGRSARAVQDRSASRCWWHGQVYRATDTRLNRKIAIKIAAERFSGRFEREARAISAFNHPNICTLHDVGPNYLVMELLDGSTLADEIRKGSMAPVLVARYGAQIASHG